MRLVILTGAGLSAESGLGTFRDRSRGGGGLWDRFDPYELATPEAFRRDPAKVLSFYDLRRADCRRAAPNAAHRALARLAPAGAVATDHQAALPGAAGPKEGGGQGGGHEVLLVTKNVDDLHERAGGAALHMHGRLMDARCDACGARWPAPETMAPSCPCPDCGAPAGRPDVVWFGEMPYALDRIAAALERADLFAAIGTSGEVYPAAGFVDAAEAAGAETVEINLAPTGRRFDRVIAGPATETVPAWVADLLGP